MRSIGILEDVILNDKALSGYAISTLGNMALKNTDALRVIKKLAVTKEIIGAVREEKLKKWITKKSQNLLMGRVIPGT